MSDGLRPFLAGALLLNRGEGAEGHAPAQSRLAPAQKFLTTVILRIFLGSAVLLSRGEGTEGIAFPTPPPVRCPARAARLRELWSSPSSCRAEPEKSLAKKLKLRTERTYLCRCILSFEDQEMHGGHID
jgi:hypothetical protein